MKKTDFDKKVKDLLRPEDRKFTVVLNSKNLVYPKQPRNSADEIGTSMRGYNYLLITSKSVTGGAFEMKLTTKDEVPDRLGKKNVYTRSKIIIDGGSSCWQTNPVIQTVEQVVFVLPVQSLSLNMQFDVEMKYVNQKDLPAGCNDLN